MSTTDSYFFLTVQIGADTIRFGPYLNISHPIMLMGDHIDILLQASGYDPTTLYTAAVEEDVFMDGEWQTIHIKVSETRE